jgi:hypothetical protein
VYRPVEFGHVYRRWLLIGEFDRRVFFNYLFANDHADSGHHDNKNNAGDRPFFRVGGDL